jgi:hypothetical protein
MMVGFSNLTMVTTMRIILTLIWIFNDNNEVTSKLGRLVLTINGVNNENNILTSITVTTIQIISVGILLNIRIQ